MIEFNLAYTLLLLTTLASSLNLVRSEQPLYAICLTDVVPQQCLLTVLQSSEEASIVCNNNTDPSQYAMWSLDQTTNVFTTTIGPQGVLCAMGVYTPNTSNLVSCKTHPPITPLDYIQPMFLDNAQTLFALRIDRAITTAPGITTHTTVFVMNLDTLSPSKLALVSVVYATKTLFTRIPLNAASDRAPKTNALLLVGLVWLGFTLLV